MKSLLIQDCSNILLRDMMFKVLSQGATSGIGEKQVNFYYYLP